LWPLAATTLEKMRSHAEQSCAIETKSMDIALHGRTLPFPQKQKTLAQTLRVFQRQLST